MNDHRCLAQALLPGGHWKRCIRDADHSEKRHVWLESFATVGRKPILVVWHSSRDSNPTVIEIPAPHQPD